MRNSVLEHRMTFSFTTSAAPLSHWDQELGIRPEERAVLKEPRVQDDSLSRMLDDV